MGCSQVPMAPNVSVRPDYDGGATQTFVKNYSLPLVVVQQAFFPFYI